MNKEQKEITIAFGNQIALTKDKKTQKQIFVKIAPAFRNKQLRELKGSALAVFLCYALHANEEGYTWVDDKTIKKETGYTITSQTRQKLIKLGYLFQERLYDEKGRFRDWIYRIFQPCEDGKEFIIRGIKQKIRLKNNPPTQEKTYIDKKPIQEKNGGIIEEEPYSSKYNFKEEPSMSGKPDEAKEKFSLKEKLKEMENDKRRHIQIIALYWKHKNYHFENETQYKSALDRDLRPASKLKGYSNERLKKTMLWLDRNTRIKWTLETVRKFIDEDLNKLAPMVKPEERLPAYYKKILNQQKYV